MSHAVHFRDASGENQLEEAHSLEAALELVERLRNEDGATHVRVFREVPVEVRTYYKAVAVEDGMAGAAEPPAGAMHLAPPVMQPRAEPIDADASAPDLARAGEHRRPLFNRG